MDNLIVIGLPIILSALLSYAVWSYKSLVTYKITRICVGLGAKDNKIHPGNEVDPILVQDVTAIEIIIENKGLKGIKDFKMHSQVNARPFSVEKHSSNIAKSDISISNVDGGIEIKVSYIPKKSSVKITFGSLRFPYLYIDSFTGDGENYRVKPLAYWEGFELAKNFFFKFVAVFTIVYGSLSIGERMLISDTKKIEAKAVPEDVLQKNNKK